MTMDGILEFMIIYYV